MILVSNRLPVTLQGSGSARRFVRSAGGLVTGLGPIHDQADSLWIGTFGSSDQHTLAQLRAQRLESVELPEEDARRHYEGYSNQVIWPLFHYLVEHVSFQGPDFEAYRRVNERFAEVVVEHAKPGQTVWVHDYHLMLLPAMLRERRPDLAIGFFLHIPFPSSEVFRILPRNEEILRGLLGADLIGLHTYGYARHLVSSCHRFLGVEFDEDWVTVLDGRCRVGVFPLGVDAAALEERARSAEVGRRLEQLRQRIGDGRRVVLSVDRMDYTKGILLRLRAYRRLLERWPEWQQPVVLVQLVVPSREAVPSYQELKEEVERSVGEINGAFSRAGMAAVDYMYRAVSPDELSALYRLADVMWVTPVRDGMNLVAKEYVAHRVDDTGVLVLSEFAGAASEMGEALLHNPWDADGSAQTLDRALRMPAEEARACMSALRRRVRSWDVHAWVRRFVTGLEQQVKGRLAESRARDVDSRRLREQLVCAFRDARQRLMVLDYDGTLVPIEPHPDDALPTDELRARLRSLTALDATEVVLLSGRHPRQLETWFGDLPLTLVAEHGLHWRPCGSHRWQPLLPEADTSWLDPVREILDEYVARTPGSFVEEKVASLAWHYRRAELSFGAWQARELAQHLSEAFANSPLEVLHGSKVVEIRPQGYNKGRALNRLVEALGAFDFQLVAGDDRTDEDMFEAAAPDAFTIKAGDGATRARYRVSDPAELALLIDGLVKNVAR